MSFMEIIGVRSDIHMTTHTQPPSVSPYLKRALDTLCLTDGIVLDIPSGTGRHSVELKARGMHVVAADLDMTVLKHSLLTPSTISRVLLDANRTLPFKDGTFDLAIIVHPMSSALMNTVPRVVRKGGYIIFETFSAHGGNWLALPHPGEIASIVADTVTQIDYHEKSVRNHPDAVTVKALFMKT